ENVFCGCTGLVSIDFGSILASFGSAEVPPEQIIALLNKIAPEVRLGCTAKFEEYPDTFEFGEDGKWRVAPLE
ncbi:MAG: hypothetical protein LBF84_04160, partial [Holosporales bacterium]|nr:hypothetical protein [Holosporales bacterium]